VDGNPRRSGLDRRAGSAPIRPSVGSGRPGPLLLQRQYAREELFLPVRERAPVRRATDQPARGRAAVKESAGIYPVEVLQGLR